MTLEDANLQAISNDRIPLCRTGMGPLKANQAGLAEQVQEFFRGLFNKSEWPARWYCGSWSDFHGWLYIISDILIWTAYFLIPIFLIRFIQSRKDFPFPKTIWLFVAFILLCGTTHLIDALIFWLPVYRVSALVRFGTAIISLITVYYLFKIFPNVLLLRSVSDLQREIDERTSVEEKMAQKNSQLQSFTHILSHNLRNHSSNIALLADFVDESTLTKDNEELFQKIKTVSKHLNGTLDDLSQVIKIRDNHLEGELLNIREVTQQVLGVLDESLHASQAQVEMDFQETEITFPHIYLESILMNLISNGIKYKKDGEHPVIKLRFYRNEMGFKTLEYSDEGKGIDLTLHADKVFGLYKTFHKHEDAHGVGLFLIKNQIEAQGGDIQVFSEVDAGITFKITFNENA
ncbi:sensor histidine kinase [Dyadobacter endophyticus]|uniref:sensor histidine kinase n=1 Tax=Dyadobacter endophyticus TaxID=1749036 RepID=UPI003CFB2CA6